MATHSSILAWEIPWREELGGLQLQSVGLQRVGYDLATNTHTPLHVHAHISRQGQFLQRSYLKDTEKFSKYKYYVCELLKVFLQSPFIISVEMNMKH